MKYADLRAKKVSGMFAMALVLLLVVGATATIWTREIGTFSVPAITLTLKNTFVAWQDRLEFNAQFGAKAPGSGIDSLLAIIGLNPPSAFSDTMASASGTTQAIPVLLYHGIVSVSTGPDETTINNFKAEMFALKNAGWQTVDIENFVAAMQGKKTLPPKSFLLTFDDGRQDAFFNATPILQALNYTAVMHVITGRSLAANNPKSSYYVTKDQLSQMLASGVWELGSHSDIGHVQYPIDASGTLGDFYGNELWLPAQLPGESSSSYATRVYGSLLDYWRYGTKWPLIPGQKETLQQYQARIVEDLINAKNDLKNELDVNALSFAYPYNDFAQDLETDSANGTPGLINFVNQIYAVSFYQWYPSLGYSENYPSIDGQLLKRIEPKPDWTPAHLLATIEQGQPKSLPYTLGSSSDGDDGWTSAWGTISQSNGILMLAANATTTGAYTILDGSRLWTNYDYEIQFNWQNAQSISLYGHYEASPKSTSYLACDFSNGEVQLENHESGTVTVLASAHAAAIAPASNDDAGLSFNGSNADCLWNGAAITGASVPSSAPSTGGVGIEIWNPSAGTAAATVTGASVH
jgi:peptidoglycan/xylan/chitin deacetylase (PgdA/CDA1 family)